MTMGLIELLLILVYGVVFLVIPLAIVVFLVIIYRKLDRIDTLLKQRNDLP